MKFRCLLCFLSLIQVGLLFGQTNRAPSRLAADLIRKAHQAVIENESNTQHWNWTQGVRIELISPSGRVIQDFPEAIYMPNGESMGKRCRLFAGWSDGVPPENREMSESERCEDTRKSSLLRVPVLLESSDVRLVGRASEQGRLGWLIEVGPQVGRLLSTDFTERCTASMRAQVLVDERTFHLLRIHGDVVREGCYHEQDASREGLVQKVVQGTFGQGTHFEVVYKLFQERRHPEVAKNVWIVTRATFTSKAGSRKPGFTFNNRHFNFRHLTIGTERYREITEISDPKEFGSKSTITPIEDH